MPTLDKGTIALTFKFDCDRFLRFRLATDAEREELAVEAETYKRPGIELIKAAGRRWEADKFQDLVDCCSPNTVVHRLKPDADPLVGRQPFDKVTNLFALLRQERPPLAIIEAEFDVPENITPNLPEIYEQFDLDPVRARPDIVWVRPGVTGAPLIGAPVEAPEYELHVIDVKMAAEPSLRHFTEVTYYALALAAALVREGLTPRYAVSAEGFIWPGSHDVNAFRNLVRKHEAEETLDPVTTALTETLLPVPYEVYEVHVRQFFETRLPRVLGQRPLDAAWHVGPKCQLCDYIRYCREKAQETDHLSRLPWLNRGQADLLRSRGIQSTNSLAAAVEEESESWRSATASSHQLRAEGPALIARTRSLTSAEPEPVPGRRCAVMPRWSDLNIYLTIHFDPGSGITFSMGAGRVYFPPGRQQGDPPQRDERVFIVDRVDDLNPETERARLIELAQLVTGWLIELSRANDGRPARDRLSAHIFLWDKLEVRQLRRMLERHMQHPDVVDVVELLIRLFPPEDQLPDPELFRSQPGTIVKDAVRLLVGLPIPHDYGLIDTANALHPDAKDDGEPFRYRLPFGFWTPMSDQIPFERAYELWQDRIFLRHFDPGNPTRPSQWRPYSRDELYGGLRDATLTHLHALQQVVRKLRQHYGARLTLRKSGFSASPPTQIQVPEAARSLVAFEKLNVACQDIENRQSRALPVAEREASFFSIRGLRAMNEADEEAVRDECVGRNPGMAGRNLLVCTFADSSRDARIREGDFTLALSNEESEFDLDDRWMNLLGLRFTEAQELLTDFGLTEDWMVKLTLSRLLQVQIVRLEAMAAPPFVALCPGHDGLFRFACEQGFLDRTQLMVLDPVYRDFSSKRVEEALRAVGGTPPPQRRRRRSR